MKSIIFIDRKYANDKLRIRWLSSPPLRYKTSPITMGWLRFDLFGKILLYSRAFYGEYVWNIWKEEIAQKYGAQINGDQKFII